MLSTYGFDLCDAAERTGPEARDRGTLDARRSEMVADGSLFLGNAQFVRDLTVVSISLLGWHSHANRTKKRWCRLGRNRDQEPVAPRGRARLVDFAWGWTMVWGSPFFRSVVRKISLQWRTTHLQAHETNQRGNLVGGRSCLSLLDIRHASLGPLTCALRQRRLVRRMFFLRMLE